MNALKEFDHINIIGKRWFQKTYGNTYHSVSVTVDGKHLDRIPFAYGYGEQYLQNAHSLLQKHGYYPKTDNLTNGFPDDYSQFLADWRENRNKFTIIAIDVNTKREL